MLIYDPSEGYKNNNNNNKNSGGAGGSGKGKSSTDGNYVRARSSEDPQLYVEGKKTNV